jgi:DNA mismatch repair protein MutS
MEYLKEILVKNYFDIHKFYENIYGDNKTIILMQVGSFFEVYCTDNDGLDLISLSQKIDVNCTKKNGNLPISSSNPRMMGFPLQVVYNYIDKLVELNYTIVLIEQITDPPNIKRKVTNIYSPATYIDKKDVKTTFILSLVIDKIKDKNQNYQLCIGLSTYDLTTGYGYIYETYSKSEDIYIGLDDALRFIECYPPREVIINIIENYDDIFIYNLTINDILNYLNINRDIIYKFNIDKHNKISWQKNLLEKVYNIERNIDILDFLDLQYINWARISLVILLDYVKLHQNNLLEKISIPKYFKNSNHLYLGNHSLSQLDVINNNTCLLNIINYTKTTMGKRYLQNQLSLPLIDSNKIISRYNIIEYLINNKHSDKICNYLEDIYDLDKLLRKLEINIIQPSELYYLYISIYQINKLIKYLIDNNIDTLITLNNIDIINNCIKYIEMKFKIENINNLNFNNITNNDIDKSFYNDNIYNEIDEIQNKINSLQNFMINLGDILENYINKDDNKSLLSLKYNERDGYYFLITNKRCDILLNKLSNVKNINIDGIKLDISLLEFNKLPKSTNTKIACKNMKDISLEINNYKIQLLKLLKEQFRHDMIDFYKNFGIELKKWTNTISFIDFINSGSICAQRNHYTKPEIIIKEGSFISSIELRHPIVEKISNNINYKPHDISLGYDTPQNGILLYGINSSGKSTLMKSIGLNIILAQIGYYTAATKFIFNPYKSLFTRINGNDNIIKGLSSFMVEMMDLMAILKRNNKHTLVIGDEICKGTEEKSANIIVCYMLETLAISDTSFITATHLHKIANMESVKNINRVKCKHLKITYDETNDMLIYNRNLLDGQGDTFYGLQVAKYLMKDKHFNDRTTEILKEYDNISEIKQSKYNKHVYVENCYICNRTDKLETHHIIWQKDFNNNKANIYLHKNDKSNLVVLCECCHDKVDRSEIIINGWMETTIGRKLDYYINEVNKKKSKYTEEFKLYIKNLKTITNDLTLARIKIKDEYDIKVSKSSIQSIWDEY